MGDDGMSAVLTARVRSAMSLVSIEAPQNQHAMDDRAEITEMPGPDSAQHDCGGERTTQRTT